MSMKNAEENHLIETFDDGTYVEIIYKQSVSWHFRYYPDSRLRKRWESENWDIVINGSSMPIGRVTTPDGRIFEFACSSAWGGTDRERAYRALIWGAIWSRTGGTRMVMDPELLPLNVVTLGKPAITAYLYSVHDRTRDGADVLDISWGTARQYLSDFLNKRR